MREFWESRYAEPEYAYGTEPNHYLVSQAPRIKAGMRALAVGDGEGRNGVWLARQGLEVLSVDAAASGQAKARRLADEAGVELATEQVDLLRWAWPKAAYDVVVSIYVHFMPDHRAVMHRSMLEALRPGGLLIMEGFHVDQLNYESGGPPLAEMLFTADMLAEDFAEAEVLELEEKVIELAEGRFHEGPAAVVRMLAQRVD